MRALIINSVLLFISCAHLQVKEIRTANLFGEIKFSSEDGFFNGRVSIITDGSRIRMDLFSPLGRTEFVYLYSDNSCIFLFVGEKKAVHSSGCEEIEIEGERIKIKELIQLALNKMENPEELRIKSYRIFDGIKFPSIVELERDKWRMKVKIMDAKFNEDVEKMFTIDIPSDFKVEEIE